MESRHPVESPDVTSDADTRWLDSTRGTASSAEEFSSNTETFTATPINDDTIRASELRVRTEGMPGNDPSVTPEERLLSYETLVADTTRFAEHAKRPSNIVRLQSIHWWWFWELGGITISVGCMVAILVLLPYLDNRPLNDWQFLVAPNTMISTFITVSKTSMLLAVAEGISQLKWHYFKSRDRSLRELDVFDAASRGPWGAFIFMIRMARKPGALLAMLGAFVVVASLTMEPFAQQILSFDGRRMNSTQDMAYFSICRVWNDTSDDGEEQQSLESGFMKGIVSSPAGFRFSCSSGNCTWPGFAALAICASCVDATEETNAVPESISGFNTSDKSYVAIHGPPNGCIDILYTTPAGVELRMSKGCSYVHDPQCENEGPRIVPGLPLDNPRYSMGSPDASTPCPTTYQTMPTTIASNATCSNFKDGVSNSTIAIHAVSRTEVTQQGLSGRIAGKANITECRIYWCEKVFQNVKVTNGLLGSINVTERDLNESQLKDRIGYWKSWFEGGRLNSSDIPNAWRYISNQMTFTVAADGSRFMSGPTSAISNATTMPETFDNIAEAMTRQLYIGNGAIAEPGVAYVQEVFVVVHWQWAVFPMVLVLLGLVFLGTNLWINSRDGVLLWKSSLLPLLFHGLDGCDPETLDVNESSDMTEAAKQIHARLEKNETGRTKLVST